VGRDRRCDRFGNLARDTWLRQRGVTLGISR
jgi:hypothetical protein